MQSSIRTETYFNSWTDSEDSDFAFRCSRMCRSFDVFVGLIYLSVRKEGSHTSNCSQDIFQGDSRHKAEAGDVKLHVRVKLR